MLQCVCVWRELLVHFINIFMTVGMIQLEKEHYAQ